MKIIAIILTFLLSSCMISTKQYTGPERPTNELAILYNAEFGDPVQIYKINGEYRGVGYVEEFEFLPGEVSLLTQFDPAKKSTPGKLDLECDLSFMPLTFVVKANTKYRVDYKFDKTTVTVWVKEASSNKIISKKQTAKIKTKSGKYLVDLGLK